MADVQFNNQEKQGGATDKPPAVSSAASEEVPAANVSPKKRKISEDLENTPSPHKAGVQREISMPKPMKL